MSAFVPAALCLAIPPARGDTGIFTPGDSLLGGRLDNGTTFDVAAPGTTSGQNQYPGNESPNHVIDGVGQKYLNFGSPNTGFLVAPTNGSQLGSVVTSIELWTANDSPERDPSFYTLYGSNAALDLSGQTTAFNLSDFTQISTGSLALPDSRNNGGSSPLDSANSQTISFTNTQPFKDYLVIFPSTKGNGALMQIAEVQLFGAINALGSVVWKGNVSGTWDINTTANFVSGANPTVFLDGDDVTFDDSATRFDVTIASAAGVKPVTVTFQNTTAHAYTISGDPIAGAAAISFNGNGMVTLNNANTYTGSTSINNGTVVLNNAAALSTSGAITMGGGTLRFTANNNVDYSPRFSSTANQAYNFDTNGQHVTFASPLSSSNGTLLKLGNGTLTLTADNSFTGGATVAGGTLQTGGGGLGTGAVVVQAGTTLDVSGRTGLAGRYFNNNGGGAQFQTNYASFTALNNHLDSLGTPAVVADATTLNFLASGGGYYYVGGVGSDPGAMATRFAAPYAVPAQGVHANFEAAFSGQMNIVTEGDYTFALNSDDGSLLTIDGQNVVVDNHDQGTNHSGFQGQTTVHLTAGAHNIELGYNQGSGDSAMITQVSGPGTGGTFVDLDSTSSGITLTPDLIISSLAGAGNVVLTTGGLIVGSDNSDTTFSGVISSPAGSVSQLEKGGTGTLTLTGANTFTGPTYLNNGALRAGNTNALQNSTVTLNKDNSLLFSAGLGTASLGSLAGPGALALQDTNAAAVNLTVGSNGATTTYSGALSGPGGLAKAGAGTMTLTGNSSYTGPTAVTGGKLIASASGSLGATSSISVNNGGTLLLTGSGFAPSAATVTLGGPGNTTGTLAFDTGSSAGTPFSQSFASLTLNSNSTLDFGAGDNATFAFTTIALGGNSLTVDHYTGDNSYSPGSTTENGSNTDRLFTNSSFTDAQLASVSFYNDSHSLISNGGHEIAFAGPNGTSFEIVPIPEPSTLASVALIGGLIGFRERRRFFRRSGGCAVGS